MLENGLLKTVTLNADSSDVLKESIGAVGDVQKAKFDAEIEAAKKQGEAVKGAQQKVVEAKAALDKATTLRAYLENYVETNAEGAAAKPELFKAKVLEQQAQADYIAAKNAAESLGLTLDPSGFNDPNSPQPGGPHAYTPILYRVIQNEESDEVELEAVKIASGQHQEKLATSTLSMPNAPTPPMLALTPKKILVTKPNRSFELTANQAVQSINRSRSTFVFVKSDNSGDPQAMPTVISQGLVLKVAFPVGLAVGNYKLVLCLATSDDKSKCEAKQVELLVR